MDEPNKEYTQKALLRKINGGNLYGLPTVSSIICTTKKGLKVKLVFVKSRTSNEYVAIASTDLALTDEQIITLYTWRWSIEVNFKTQKQFLGLSKECQGHCLDIINAFMVLSNIRMQFMELNRRHQEAPRALGEIFCSIGEELKAMPFSEALASLLDLVDSLADTLEARGCIKEEKLEETKAVIAEKLGSWFFGITEYVRAFIQKPQLSQT